MDCFAIKNSRCKALKVKQCEGCGFYKSREQFKQDIEKVNKRIGTLDSTTQAYIAGKYRGAVLDV